MALKQLLLGLLSDHLQGSSRLILLDFVSVIEVFLWHIHTLGRDLALGMESITTLIVSFVSIVVCSYERATFIEGLL